MQKYQVLIYPKAQKDIEDIYDYILLELCSKSAADNLMKKIYEGLERISIVPFSCPLINIPLSAEKNLRKLIIDKYIIFYYPDSDTEIIKVIRVLYGMMNYKDIL